MNDLRIGMIGAGFMGNIHAQIAKDLLGVKVTAVSDINFNRSKKLAEQCNANHYADYHDMLQKEQLDAVIITTPELDHREPVIYSAKAGCHIFLEKPIAASLEDADIIVESCEKAGVYLMTGYILRFEPCYAHIHDAIIRGDVGNVLSIYARRNATIQEARRLGGRTTVINYLSVHDIDQILWYRPEHYVKKVFAKSISGRCMEEFGVPDFCWILLEFDDGAIGVVEVGWGLTEGWSGFSDVKMNVIGTNGVLSLDFNPMNIIQVTPQGFTYPETRHWPVVNGRYAGAALLEIEHFIDCIRNDRKPSVDGLAGRKSLEVALAAELSIAENREVLL